MRAIIQNIFKLYFFTTDNRAFTAKYQRKPYKFVNFDYICELNEIYNQKQHTVAH